MSGYTRIKNFAISVVKSQERKDFAQKAKLLTSNTDIGLQREDIEK